MALKVYNSGIYNVLDNSTLEDDGTGIVRVKPSGVTATEIAANAVETSEILDLTILADDIATGAVTNTKLDSTPGSEAVSTSTIRNQAITNAKIQINTIGQDRIGSNAVGTDELINGNVTRAKLEAVGQQISASSGNFGCNSETDVTNFSLTITTSGRPVVIGMMPDGSSNRSRIQCIESSGNTAQADVRLYRNGGFVSRFNMMQAANGITTNTQSLPPGCIIYVDNIGAGTYTYKFTLASTNPTGSTAANVQYCKMYVFEL